MSASIASVAVTICLVAAAAAAAAVADGWTATDNSIGSSEWSLSILSRISLGGAENSTAAVSMSVTGRRFAMVADYCNCRWRTSATNTSRRSLSRSTRLLASLGRWGRSPPRPKSCGGDAAKSSTQEFFVTLFFETVKLVNFCMQASGLQSVWISYIYSTRNTLVYDQSNYSSSIVFSHTPTESGQTGISAIRSANLENPTVEPNMKWIGQPLAEIWPFEIFQMWGRCSVAGRSVGRQYILLLLHWSHILLFATLGT